MPKDGVFSQDQIISYFFLTKSCRKYGVVHKKASYAAVKKCIKIVENTVHHWNMYD